MPSILNDTDLNYMRNTIINNLFPHLGTVMRCTQTVDNNGGVVLSYTAGTVTYCRLEGVSTRYREEAIRNDRLAAIPEWRIYVPYDVALYATDHILCNGHTFEVESVIDTHSFGIEGGANIRRLD